jgi:hypothetical protein
MLWSLFPPDECAPSGQSLEGSPNAYEWLHALRSAGFTDLSRYSLVSGHFPLALREAMRADVRTLTFLREPYARSISHLKHRQAHTHLGWSLEQVLRDTRIRNHDIRDRQAMQLGLPSLAPAIDSLEREQAWRFRPDRNLLARAKERLDSLDFIGLTERFPESVRLCEQTFGWTFHADLNENVTAAVEEDERKVRAALEQYIQLDLELYEYGVALFERRLRLEAVPVPYRSEPAPGGLLEALHRARRR